MNCYRPRGCMKRGKDFYNIIKPDGSKFVGLHDLDKVISLCRELNKLYDCDQPHIGELEAMAWHHSNGKSESVT